MRTAGGGVLVALGMTTGAIVGVLLNQGSAGVLVGTALGLVAALVFARRDARRHRD